MTTAFYHKKSLGQHFLKSPGIFLKIIEAGKITKQDTVLEIGPGTGELTKRLLEKAKKVVTVEKDNRLIPILKAPTSKNLRYCYVIIPAQIKPEPYRKNCRRGTRK